jgi:deoxyuridine 5'-triphosphate nucleotidohydrolase
MPISIKRLAQTATIPTYATERAAGVDLYANESVLIPARGQALIKTGIAIAIDPDKCGLIWPRSGLDAKHGITTGAGVIDSDYRGEIGVLLRNHSDVDYRVKHGERIAQMLIVPAYRQTLVEVDALPDTGRGAGGFGSTGGFGYVLVET